MSILRTRRIPVKATRHSERPDAPFGSGILPYRPFVGRVDHEASDERWWAEQSATAEFAPYEGYPDDATMNEMAMQAEWERRFDALVAARDVCELCGLTADGPLANGLCAGCEMADRWEGIA